MEDFAISITNKLLTNAAAGSIIGSSVVSFATSPILESDYTTNTSVTLNALASLSYTGGFTDHGGAISTCQSTLPPGEKNFILLVTDGLPTVGSDPTGIGISSAAAAKGDGTTIIPVYITGDPLPSSTQTYLQGLSSDGSFYSKDFDELNSGRLVRNVADDVGSCGIESPTIPPSLSPSANPTILILPPSRSPSKKPTNGPTLQSDSPTLSPQSPSTAPTLSPDTTDSPTINPSSPPSKSPSVGPTKGVSTLFSCSLLLILPYSDLIHIICHVHLKPSSAPTSSSPTTYPTDNATNVVSLYPLVYFEHNNNKNPITFFKHTSSHSSPIYNKHTADIFTNYITVSQPSQSYSNFKSKSRAFDITCN